MKAGVYEIGALIRGSFRRTCMKLNLEYKEDKGWFDSGFVVEGNLESIKRLNGWLDELSKIEGIT